MALINDDDELVFTDSEIEPEEDDIIQEADESEEEDEVEDDSVS